MKPLKILNRLFNRTPNNNLLSVIHEQIYNTPLQATPDSINALIYGYVHNTVMPVNSSLMEVSSNESRTTYYLTPEAAVMCISGALTTLPIQVDACSNPPLSYSEILHDLRAIQADSNVSTLILHFSSGGGATAGMVNCANQIREAQASGLRIIAMVETCAASAAYGLASACNEIVVTADGVVGSIGTFIALRNNAKENEMKGVEFTYICSDTAKTNGSPEVPLTDAARQAFTDDVLAVDAKFKQMVANHRNMDVSAIYAMEARCYRGELAIAAGLADKVGTFESLIEEVLTTTREKNRMSVTAEQFQAQSEQIAKMAESIAALTGAVSQIIEAPQAKANESAIADMCAAANVPDAMAKLLIKSGATIEEVRASLIDSQAAKSETVKIDGFLSAKLQGDAPKSELKSAAENLADLEQKRLDAIRGK